jgi:outer membrane receptor for ferrienterochelin and colicins
MSRGPALALLVTLLLVTASPAQAQEAATLSGTISDAQDGSPLAGANLALSPQGSATITSGTASDPDGQFQLTGIPAGDYTLRVSFIGFQQQELPLSLQAGEQRSLDIALAQAGFDLNAVVVTASRQAEKVLDAPASISVIDLEAIQQNPAPSPDALLKNTTGVDYAQTGVDRTEVVLRGFNNAFSGATYVLTDYRQAAVPSLGVNVFSIMPAFNLDLEQVEVVRGPGSALYGAGVDAGVVHFFTKDPFRHAGTALSLAGGERSLFSGAFRHAGAIQGRWGYKLTGQYARADDWQLDPSDSEDQEQLEGDAVPRNYDYEKYNLNASLAYRFNEQTELTVGGGFSQLTGIVLSGIGTLQGDGFGYTYAQARLQSGPFFAQAYFNKNDAGDSFVYGTGQEVVDKSSQFNAQAQYDLAVAGGRHQVVFGADFEVTTPDTDETIYGRNEEDAQITEVGAYAQASLALSEQLDAVVAARGDYNNVVEQFQVSPRAALVYKPAPEHSLRASYNRAFSSPGNNSLFLDIGAQTTTLPTGQRIIFQGRGSVDGFTFADYRATGTALFSLPVPGLFGQPVPVNEVPVAPVYGVAAAQIVPLLQSDAPLPEPIPPLTRPQRDLLAQLVGYTALSGTVGAAATAGTLGIPNDSPRGFREVAGPVDIEPLEQTTSQTFELGYKGIFAERLLVAVDGYYATKKNFVGPLVVESPLVYVEAIAQDLGVALGGAFASGEDPTINALLQQLGQAGIAPAQALQLIAGMVGGGLAGTPAAIVQPDQPVLPAGTENAVGGFLAYRNYGSIQYWGLDASLELLATERISFFGNISLVSDDFFDNEELDETNTALALALNAPTLKWRLGGSYTVPQGLYANVAGRYTKGFPVISGPYVGEVEDYFLLDVGVGYDFGRYAPGLRLDLQAQNVLDELHREFVGAPKLGRMLIARATYSF